MGRIELIKEFNLSASPEGRLAFKQLLARCTTSHNADFVHSDLYSYIIDADLIRASSVSEKVFSAHWSRIEWLQQGWINACVRRYGIVASMVKANYPDIIYANDTLDLRKYDLLHATISTLSKNELSTSSKIKKVIGQYKTGSIIAFLREAIACKEELTWHDAKALQAFSNARMVAYELWNLLEIDPERSDWGRLQISYDTSSRESVSIELDPSNFPIEQDRDATLYWGSKHPTILLNRNQVLSASDLPLDVVDFSDAFAESQGDFDENDANETIRQLLNEAVALREWTIPPNAFVAVSIGPFVGAEVTEIGDDVFFIWRTANNRYYAMVVGTDKQTFAYTEVFTESSPNHVNRKAELSIRLLMSAIIRDFWVVTERQKIFGVKVSRTGRQISEGGQSRVVYLPRVRYLGSRIDLARLNLDLSYKQRSQHYVRPHFRRANPSELQLEIAIRARRIVPEGYTYVQGHYRGVKGTQGRTVYRSRSAMALLFGAGGPDLNQPDHLSLLDWFGFEQAVSILLEKSFNFTIVHRATRGKTDYGIDILATKCLGTQIETWVVQCKCYKPTNLVKPSHMRELIGSIADLQRDGVAPIRGMMVTTSRISGDALALAVKHGIQCVAGDDLNLILDLVNWAISPN